MTKGISQFLNSFRQGGIYFFQLIDYFVANVSVVYLAFFEVIAVTWFYGAGRLARNVQEMTGRFPSLYFRFCWTIAAPVLIFVSSLPLPSLTPLSKLSRESVCRPCGV